MFSNVINGYLLKLLHILRLASYPVSLSERAHLCLLPPAAVKPVTLNQTASALSNMPILHLVP